MNIELPYDSGIPLLGMYTQDNWKHVHTKTCVWMFIVALLIIAKETT